MEQPSTDPDESMHLIAALYWPDKAWLPILMSLIHPNKANKWLKTDHGLHQQPYTDLVLRG